MIPSLPNTPRAPGCHEGGFSLLEVLIAAAVIGIAVLGHTASLFSEQKLSASQQSRSAALLAADQFMERMRSDDDWAGMYSRFRTLALAASKPGPGVRLDDGRLAYPVADYYDDFTVPAGIRELHILVDVPAVPEASAGAAEPALVLREDAVLADFSLPADLDGDGLIDDAAHDDNYRVLPVVVTLRWQALGSPTEELELSSWLWGQR